ncbi:T-cell immunoglobulin and mucin domain-containing protein 4 isoform X2 [Hippopotamus amphibius kiboko]|uniref:T-cell immunoglobulin and mucin domain-containing protein 4 isoform X2 n=1 Tax=Hippopotamus amphibius kiboko TaxID=575201 RepID=UPI00259550FC|nr:T-cell immunoglobulin and mucin domain-containing protein 4 isoform X2 [Hippopotamus amphibius kiboko]
MSKGPLILWLVIELGQLSLTPAASEIVVRAFLGETVTLPCTHSSWYNRNSMCWGRGQCPNSKCNDELLYTDGMKTVSRKSPKYQLRGSIQRGEVSLTIFNTNEGDGGVYCCRIEVPGWFNDVKKNIRLELRRAPTTMRSTTTRRPTTTITTAGTTSTAVLPATVVTTPNLATTSPLQMGTTAELTTTAATFALTTWSSLPEEDTILLTLEPSTEEPILTAESETVLLPRTSQSGTEATSGDTALFTSKASKGWVLQSTSQASVWEASDLVTSQPRASETPFLVQNEVESEQIKMTNDYDLFMIIASSLGFVMLALLLAFFLRGKVMKMNPFQKHNRLDNVAEVPLPLTHPPTTMPCEPTEPGVSEHCIDLPHPPQSMDQGWAQASH